MNPLKIAIVVPGRFHAFDMARALIARDHDVTVFTNYPKWAAARFGLPGERVRSLTAHGVASRAMGVLERRWRLKSSEAPLSSWFGRWAAAQVARERWDVIHCWSGVSEELLSAPLQRPTMTLLMRGSSHIAVQSRLLREEERRSGIALDRPSQWILEREGREYRRADHIVVLSEFARQSFLAEGVPPDRVSSVPLGVDLRGFRPSPDVIADRCARIEGGEPLRVLYVGALSLRKGLLDLARIAAATEALPCEFTLVGPVMKEALPVLQTVGPNVRLVPARPQSQLVEEYRRGDVFIFPTIEDGYAMVLAQAKASALPILATTNCSAPDLLQDGEDGWVLPIRDPEVFARQLRWCVNNRGALAAMVRKMYEQRLPRDWSDVAADFERMVRTRQTRSRDEQDGRMSISAARSATEVGISGA